MPTNRTVPRFCARPEMKFIASVNSGSVFSRLMMWILPRAPKMYGAMRGIPVTGLVTEMHAGFEHLAHGDLRHDVTPMNGTKPRYACEGG